MPDYTIKWPLEFNYEGTGFKTVNHDNIKEVAFFNLKNILLTIPGERIMFPNFGVGIKQYLFQQDGNLNLQELESKILSQVGIWAPYINIEKFDFSFLENQLNLLIYFSVPSADIKDVLKLNIEL